MLPTFFKRGSSALTYFKDQFAHLHTTKPRNQTQLIKANASQNTQTFIC